MKDPITQDMTTRSLCELLNHRLIMVIETQKDQEVVYYDDKILTENTKLLWDK